jgi:transposase
MTPEELFTAALGLGQQWRVVECRFEGEPKRLELRLEHVRGQHFECPQCGTLCGVHDTIERHWRHLNFFQYRCELVAKVPRTWCHTDGGASDTGALGTGRQRFYPDDGRAHDAAEC